MTRKNQVQYTLTFRWPMDIGAEEELWSRKTVSLEWRQQEGFILFSVISIIKQMGIYTVQFHMETVTESGLERLKAGFQYQSVPCEVRCSISCQEEPAPGNAAGSRHHSWIWMTVLLKLSPAFLLEKTVPKEAQFYIPHELTKAAKENIWCTNQKLMRKYLGVFPGNMWRGMEGRLRG